MGCEEFGTDILDFDNTANARILSTSMKICLKQKSSKVNTWLIIWPRSMSVLENTMPFSNSISMIYQTIIQLIRFHGEW